MLKSEGFAKIMEAIGEMKIAVYVNGFQPRQGDKKVIIFRAGNVTKSQAREKFAAFKKHNEHLQSAICEAQWQAYSETLIDE